MKIPMTAEEKAEIAQTAQGADAKPVTWAREILLQAARHGIKKSGRRGS